MWNTVALASLLSQSLVVAPHPAASGCLCVDSTYCQVSFSRTFDGIYRHGEPYDVVTVSPDGSGETFAGTGITIRVVVRRCNGQPIAGVPAEYVLLYSPNLCICPGGHVADHPTDANGVTEFTGTLRGGDCADQLDLYVDGCFISSVPVKINSTDSGSASPCFVDQSDLAALASRLTTRAGVANYSICFDYNEDGYVNSSDIAFFAAHLGSACPP